MDSYWRKCTTCKKPIGFNQKYWICSVSTCNRTRTDLVFCDLRCFDAHVPVMNHRDAGAYERRSPSEKDMQKAVQQAESSEKGQQPFVQDKVMQKKDESVNEILVVVSKVKAYIRSRSGMSTSDAVMEVLTEKVQNWADIAIQNAQKSGRKTVLDRDVLGLK